MKKSIFANICLILAFIVNVKAQSTFEKIFRVDNQSTEVNAVFPVADGNILLTQHGNGIVNFTKLDLNGNFVTGTDVFDTNSGFVMSASMTGSGNILVTGVAYDDDSDESGPQHGFFLKVSPGLAVQAALKFVPFAGNGDCWASGAIEAGDGSIVILAKSTVTSIGGIDNYFEIIKMNGNASQVTWSSAILAGNENTVFDIAETTAGYEIYGGIKHKDTNWNLYLGTINKTGTEMLRQLIVGGGDWDGAYDIQEDAKRKVRNLASRIAKNNGTLTIAAYTRSYGSNTSNTTETDGNSIFLMNYPVSGNSYNWTAILDGKGNEKIFGPFGSGNLIALKNGDLLLSGFTSSTGPETPYPGGFMYRFEAKSNGTITPLWQHVFTPPNNLTPMGIAEAADGSLFLTGNSNNSTKEGVVIQTTSEGISPVGCISANYGNLSLKSITPSVLSTTNAALLSPTLNITYAETISKSTTITTICSANSENEKTSPVLGTEPQSQTVGKGQSARLTVQAAGSQPMHFQWYRGDSGDESSPVGTDSLAFTTPNLSTTTSYWVKISNSQGTINSATAIITVEDFKWKQTNWGDYRQKPYQLLLTKGNIVLVLTQDVVTNFGPDDWPCSSPPGKLYMLNPETGEVLWSIDLGHSAAPAIGDNGYIYTNIENRLYAVNPANGQMSLVFTADRNITSSLALSKDGMAYFGAGQKVLAVNLNTGVQEWEEPTDKFVIQHPSIGVDGTVYVIPWRLSGKLYAFWPHKAFDNNELKWVCNIPGLFSTAPAIGIDGTIYAGAYSKLVAVNPVSGTVKWEFTTPIAPAGYPTIQNITSEPVIGNNGTIYFSAITMGDSGGALYAIHPEGYPKWFFSSGWPLFTSPVLAGDETIYYPADKLYVLDLYGKEIWSKEAAGPVSPALASDGSTYVCSWNNNAVTALAGEHNGLMIAHWPAFAHDFQRTAQHDDSFVGIPPIITKQPENALIKSGQTATFSVSATGDPEISYQWYEGIAGDKSKPLGADSIYTTPALTKMTNYWVEVENEFGKDVSTTVMASTGNEGEVKWYYITNPTWDPKQDGEIMSGIALANDGTLYFGVYDCRLFAMNPDGTLKWIANVQAYNDKYQTEYAVSGSTPTIAPDGTIFINTLGYYYESFSIQHDFGILWAINPDGSEKWRYEAGNFSISDTANYTDTWLRGSAAIGHDGTIYIATEGGSLHAVNPDGSKKWVFNARKNKGWYRGLEGGPPAVGTDGTIYYAAGGEYTLHTMADRETSLFAINPDGSYKWDFMLLEDKVFFSEFAPTIGPDGKIFMNNGDSYVDLLYAINPDGTKAWEFHTGQNTTTSAVIGHDSTIYVAGNSYINSAHRVKLYALDYMAGTEKWQFPKEGQTGKYGFAATAVIGNDKNIYFGIPDMSYGKGEGRIFALRPDGTEIWNNPPYVGAFPNSSLVIAPDGTLYTGTGEGYESYDIGFLYAINTSAFGVANTSWPMDGQNPHRTQRAVGFPACEEPAITLQPEDTEIFNGQAVKLMVNATGTELSYQWFEGTDRSKPVGKGKSFTTPDLSQTTLYWVQVSNTCGSVNSRTATVTVTAPQLRTEYATLASVLVNDKPINGFTSEVYEYTVELPVGTVEIPPIKAYSSAIGAEIEVRNATELPGTCYIDVTSPDGVTKQTYIIHFTIATGIEDFKRKGELTIYPNPAKDKFKVQSSEFQVEELEIYDLNGRKLFERQIPTGTENIEVNISHLKNGVYFCRLFSEKYSVTKKLIIQK